jgi:hypothetical protein
VRLRSSPALGCPGRRPVAWSHLRRGFRPGATAPGHRWGLGEDRGVTNAMQVRSIGGRIREIRIWRDMSLKATAELAGITESYLSRIVNHDWIANSPTVQDATAPASAHRPAMMVTARSGGIRHGEPATDLLLARPRVTAGLIHPPVVRHSGRPEPVSHPLRDGPRGVLSLPRARARPDRHQISNRSAIPHQVHDLTSSHPVNRPRQGGRILHRQFLGIHARSVANRPSQRPYVAATMVGHRDSELSTGCGW